MYIYTFLLRMTDAVTSRNIERGIIQQVNMPLCLSKMPLKCKGEIRGTASNASDPDAGWGE
jgi:hypothetical protein